MEFVLFAASESFIRNICKIIGPVYAQRTSDLIPKAYIDYVARSIQCFSSPDLLLLWWLRYRFERERLCIDSLSVAWRIVGIPNGDLLKCECEWN